MRNTELVTALLQSTQTQRRLFSSGVGRTPDLWSSNETALTVQASYFS